MLQQKKYNIYSKMGIYQDNLLAIVIDDNLLPIVIAQNSLDLWITGIAFAIYFIADKLSR